MRKPSADVVIDEPLVKALVAEQCPGLDGRTVARLGSGWEYEAYAVGDDTVLRLPRRAASVPWLEREIEILALVDATLPGLVPGVTIRGRPSAVFPYPFVGYPRLPGVEASVPTPRLASDVGAALGRLHGVDTAAIRPTPDGWEDEELAALAVELAAVGAQIEGRLGGRLGALAAPYLAGAVAPPPARAVRRLVHNDVCAEHLLVDPASGRLTGLLDFSDAMVGDPAVDFAGLLTVGPHAFVGAVARAYPAPLGDGFWARYGWITRVRTLIWLAEAAEAGEDPSRQLLWVARAFEPGPSADGSYADAAARPSVRGAPSAEGM